MSLTLTQGYHRGFPVHLSSFESEGEVSSFRESREDVKLQVILDRIDNIDLSMVKMKLCLPVEQEGKGWLSADRAEKRYKMYLKLYVLYPNAQLPPNHEIDEMWHGHILYDTKKYHEDCQHVFGKYLHHYGYFGLRGEQDAQDLRDAFEKTQMLFKEHFGIDLSAESDTGCGPNCRGSGCSSHPSCGSCKPGK